MIDKEALTDLIEEMTILQMSELMDKDEISSVDLVKAYLERIARIDKSGPSLNSILEVNPDALHIAEALDAERKHKGKRGVLHGIPIVVKDSINTGDKCILVQVPSTADLYAP